MEIAYVIWSNTIGSSPYFLSQNFKYLNVPLYSLSLAVHSWSISSFLNFSSYHTASRPFILKANLMFLQTIVYKYGPFFKMMARKCKWDISHLVGPWIEYSATNEYLDLNIIFLVILLFIKLDVFLQAYCILKNYIQHNHLLFLVSLPINSC